MPLGTDEAAAEVTAVPRASRRVRISKQVLLGERTTRRELATLSLGS
jgi:hypothetical protein